jgi:hypothetical protein
MDGTGAEKLTAHQQACLEHIQACEASGMTLAAYAAQKGLDVGPLYGARKVLKRKGLLAVRQEPSRFQRVRVALVDSDVDWRVALPNGVTVAFSGAVEAGVLSTVLSAAAGLG